MFAIVTKEDIDTLSNGDWLTDNACSPLRVRTCPSENADCLQSIAFWEE